MACESPNCGAELPLLRNCWLSKTKSLKRALRITLDRASMSSSFAVFEPTRDSDVASGTVRRSRPTCLFCRAVLPQARLQAQLQAQMGGGDVHIDAKGRRVSGATLIAVVTKKGGRRGYRAATERDYAALALAAEKLAALEAACESANSSPVPTEPLARVDQSSSALSMCGSTESADGATYSPHGRNWYSPLSHHTFDALVAVRRKKVRFPIS